MAQVTMAWALSSESEEDTLPVAGWNLPPDSDDGPSECDVTPAMAQLEKRCGRPQNQWLATLKRRRIDVTLQAV